jgi:uncharacterized protein (TIGR03084 family)
MLAEVLADLEAESADLDRLVADLPPSAWDRPTPSPGWSIAHQIAHLAWTDRASRLAISATLASGTSNNADRDAYTAHLAEAMANPESFVDRGAEESLAEPDVLLARWRAGRAALADALRAVPAGHRIAWYGGTMSATSMATARIMETWAHGLDVADALGVSREPTARLRHIAHLGHRTMGYSFLANGREAPTVPVALILDAPDGSTWSFGPASASLRADQPTQSADDRVTGPALDFCLLVTRRRHRADLALKATGPVADEWLDIAQAFAGPPGAGREPNAERP